MERESFEDNDVARLLNESFISIKVDREERPDVDHIYMDVCQALTGHGGWPLTVIMTPEQKPFFAGTYFPKHDRMGIQGIITILEAVKDAWKTKRNVLLDSSKKIIDFITKKSVAEKKPIPENVIDEAFSLFSQYFDKLYGGFGNAPKFPTPHNLMFLLRYYKKTNDQRALYMVEKTLESMYKGGIYDHIGFGFCRYSTDKKWLVPHFEKMLYDNALIAIIYLEAFHTTQKIIYKSIANDILTYILRDMTSPQGGFFSAEDADSEGEEGKFYVWSLDEIINIIGDEDAKTIASYYDISNKGNFEGKSIPNLISNDLPFESIKSIKPLRKKLFEYRENRIHPYKDDKILTSWNGLMIGAMAIAGRMLKDDTFTRASIKAVEFIFDNLVNNDDRLLARYRDGESDFLAYSTDYAFLIFGLIELYETTYETKYLIKAVQLSDSLIELFWDNENAGLFVYGKDGESLITRPKEIYDGAIPSSNSVTALNFLRLARLTGRDDLEEKANLLLRAFSNEIINYPIGHSYALMALLFASSNTQEVVIISDSYAEAKPFLDKMHDVFRPFSTSLFYNPNDDNLKKLAPFVESYKKVNGKTVAYICEGFSCQEPVTDYEAFGQLLN